MHRRAFLKTGSTVVAGLAITGCLPHAVASTAPSLPPRRRLVDLVPVDASWDRVIRTTVGLRPYRDSGFMLAAEKLDEKTVIHNYGHGGAGWSLSWGTGYLATELALAHTERRAAVIGCGAVGLTTARQLQRHGFEVTIYAKALPPETTSNMSWAGFTPVSGLFAADHRTPQWDAQFRRAIEIAYREHQLLVGSHYGVFWLDEYFTMSGPNVTGGRGGGGGGGGSSLEAGLSGPPLLPPSLTLGRTVLAPGEHPFASPYAARVAAMRFEPGIYLEALMRDVLTFGGRIVVRSFDARQELMSLPETLIVNCTGLGAKALFGDEELTPVKGQLTMLVPQPEVTYSVAGMTPRSDGIALGHVSQKGVWSTDVDEDERKKVVDRAIAFFRSMRVPGQASS